MGGMKERGYRVHICRKSTFKRTIHDKSRISLPPGPDNCSVDYLKPPPGVEFSRHLNIHAFCTCPSRLIEKFPRHRLFSWNIIIIEEDSKSPLVRTIKLRRTGADVQPMCNHVGSEKLFPPVVFCGMS